MDQIQSSRKAPCDHESCALRCKAIDVVIVPSQCLQRLGSGGASSSPSSRCRTGMAAHPAPAPPPPVCQYEARALHLDRSLDAAASQLPLSPTRAARPGR
ncbi:hypothetical protein SFRURICE_012374 [Spodoptera frugiperda]|uniref:SFRICE_001613 n=1 Tax=Spodoptera frugiperda TaxID=7108 RepID=A0A2H1V6Y1_SPOFR|nr:hypothetical protein SFRURICE_012374 [Spodoptera frugiperda]